MTRFPVFRAAFIAALIVPSISAADGFDGTYEYGYCSGEAGNVALRIEGTQVSYYETPCTLSDAVAQDNPAGAVQYTLTCDYGSGPTADTVVLRFDGDGALVMRSGDLEDRFLACE
ncbi:hypothetical protein roselon_03479 [Roseibacterium elongatum DSM 19469]|uniref:Uncharacterized protein n=1 Tax=Roseicyclus elongatus DSM 19469 TaxID=1294273 RepID=W8RWZ5_9RHOB|nr:hypothetical protein [Roseibacterium elongatum]AHM05734.1 hypothetical protein roselon_03479 [Roseibacterium elongatum DSM 19469]